MESKGKGQITNLAGALYLASGIFPDVCMRYCVSEQSDQGEKGRLYSTFSYLPVNKIQPMVNQQGHAFRFYHLVFLVALGMARSKDSSDSIYNSSNHTAWGELVSRSKSVILPTCPHIGFSIAEPAGQVDAPLVCLRGKPRAQAGRKRAE